MIQIKEYTQNLLKFAVQHSLSDLEFAAINLWEGTMSEDELTHSLDYLNQHGVVKDAITLLLGTASSRLSICYGITFPGMSRRITFEVVNTQFEGPSPHGFLGHLYTTDETGKDVRQLTIDNMWIKPTSPKEE